jgi:hypothetical protein
MNIEVPEIFWSGSVSGKTARRRTGMQNDLQNTAFFVRQPFRMEDLLALIGGATATVPN